jgi:hypothetical protein
VILLSVIGERGKSKAMGRAERWEIYSSAKGPSLMVMLPTSAACLIHTTTELPFLGLRHQATTVPRKGSPAESNADAACRVIGR